MSLSAALTAPSPGQPLDRGTSQGATVVRRWTRICDPASLTVGGIFGVLLLHPAAMLYASPPHGTSVGNLFRAVSASFDSSMLPMTATFVVLGAALALACQAARTLTSRDAEPRPNAEARPFLRMCMYCKGIPQTGADGEDRWMPLEQVLYDTEGIEFSHGVCPHCYEVHLAPQLRAAERKRRRGRRGPSDAGRS